MTGKLSSKQASVLGFVVIACLLIGAWGMFQIGGKTSLFADEATIQVSASDAQNIEKGSPVEVRGVEAGYVKEVEITDNGIIFHLKVKKKYEKLLKEDAFAQVKAKGLMGSNVVALHPGKSAVAYVPGTVVPGRSANDLADVSEKMSSVIARVDRVLDDAEKGQGTLPKLLKDDSLYNELKETSTETKKLIKNLDQTTTEMRRDAQKTLGNVNESLDTVKGEVANLKELTRTGQEAVTAIKQDAEAVKAMPIVRSYVEDAAAILVRPQCKDERILSQSSYLFDGKSAVLSAEGKKYLDEIGDWLNSNKHKNSEIVVVAYVDPKEKELTGAAAKQLSKKQAEIISDYLKERGVHKMSYTSRRKVTPLGMGFDPAPVADPEKLPGSRIEIHLFVPQG